MAWQRRQSKGGSSMAEAAITLPVVVLLTFAMVNLARPGTQQWLQVTQRIMECG